MKLRPVTDIHTDNSFKQTLPQMASIIQALNDRPVVLSSTSHPLVRVKFGDNEESVRSAISRGKSGTCGFFHSKLTGRTIRYEFGVEKCGFLNLESNPLVKDYRDQPAFIYYTMDGEEHWHIPDCYAVLANGKRCFIEFKDNDYVNHPGLVARTRFLATHLPFIGYSYVVIIKDQMSDIVADNVTKLYRLARGKVSIEKILVFKRMFYLFQSISVRKLMDMVSAVGITKADLYVMILSGQVKFDWQYPLTEDTELAWGA